MRKRFLIPLLLLITLSVIQAQPARSRSGMPTITLRGTVVDSTFGEPLAYANISVVSLRRERVIAGTMTDAEGEFVIPEIPPGRHELRVEFIGYEPRTVSPVELFPGGGRERDLGVIRLAAVELELEAVEVRGEQPLYRQTAEMKVFNVEQSSVAKGGSALDALEQIPGVEVDIDGKVSLRGSSNVNILLDGRPSLITGSDQEMVLEAIPASSIRDIEVITNPSARYNPEGMAGIINIVLKENRLTGLNGSVALGGSTLGSGSVSGQVNYRTDKFNLFLNSGWRHSLRAATGDNYRETYGDSLTALLDQRIEGERGGDSRLVKTGFELYPAPGNRLGATLTYNDRAGVHDRSVEAREEVGDSLWEYTQISTGDGEQNNLALSLFFDRDFAQPRHRLSLDADLSRGRDKRPSALETVPAPGYEAVVDADPEQTRSEVGRDRAALKLDYTRPFGEQLRLEAGYNGTLRYLDHDHREYVWDDAGNRFVLDDTLSNRFRFDENIQAVYAQLQWKRERTTLQAGLRGELVYTTTELLDSDELDAGEYASLYPSAAFTLELTEQLKLQTSYSRRVRRPRDRQLNPAVFKMDERSIRQGNPHLQPEYTDAVELSLSHFRQGINTSLTAYYRRTTDKISRFKELRPDGVTVMTYENFAEKTSNGLELVFSGGLGRRLNLMVSGNLYSDQVDVSNLTETYDATAIGYAGRFSLIWNLTPATEFSYIAVYRSPRDIPIGRIEAMTFSDCSLKRQFLQDRLSLTLRVSDIFNSRGFRFETYDETYYQESSRKFASRRLALTLEYRFGKLEEQPRRKREQQVEGFDQGGYGIE